MAEFSLNGIQYRTTQMDVMRTQLHVLRRLSPASFELLRIFKALENGITAELIMVSTFDDWTPVVAKMSDADVDYIRDACLTTIEVCLNGLWVRLLPPGGKLAYPDLTLNDIFRLMGAVISETFIPFFRGLAKPSSEVSEAKAT